jgi:hypothetical protein
MSPLLAFNTAISFITGTNWQAYEGVYVLTIPVVVLIFSSISLVISAGTGSILNHGLHGLTEVTYAYASVAQNNGSAFAGLAAKHDLVRRHARADDAHRPVRADRARAHLRGLPDRRHRDRRRPHLLPDAHPWPHRRAHHRLTARR